MIIKKSYAREEHYYFLKDVYPWNWGTKEKFFWKHSEDPFCGDDVYEAYEEGILIGILIARKYLFKVKGEIMNFLCLMDFAVRKDFSNKGVGKLIENSISDNPSIDAKIGTASTETYNKYYNKVPCYCEIKETTAYAVKPVKFSIINNSEDISKRLNNNNKPFYIERTPQYVDWIKKCPDFKEVVFISDMNDNIAGIGIKDNLAHIIEFSTMSEEFLKWSISAASNFNSMVKFDVPEFIDLGNLEVDIISSKNLHIVFNPISSRSYKLIKNNDKRWIPKVDRK
ncbi:MAG: hypothetical protein LIR50_18885 [Bacillota bacterium]|nr:hypothetical protein [Bacillota bacterium]